MVEPKGTSPGRHANGFPGTDSPLHVDGFSARFTSVTRNALFTGAPLLADRGISTRFVWADDSPAFTNGAGHPKLAAWNYRPRIS